jgi:hypothetical protein
MSWKHMTTRYVRYEQRQRSLNRCGRRVASSWSNGSPILGSGTAISRVLGRFQRIVLEHFSQKHKICTDEKAMLQSRRGPVGHSDDARF